MSDKTIKLRRNELLLMNRNVEHADYVQSDSAVLYIQLPAPSVWEVLDNGLLAPWIKDFFVSGENQTQLKREYLHFVPRSGSMISRLIDMTLEEEEENPGAGSLLIIWGLIIRILDVLGNTDQYERFYYSEDISDTVLLYKRIEYFLAERNWNYRPGVNTVSFILAHCVFHVFQKKIYFFFFGSGSSGYIASNRVFRKLLSSTLSTRSISFAPS